MQIGQGFSLTLTMDFSNLSCFFSHTIRYKSMWLSAIRAHCLPALHAFNTGMRQKAYHCSFKWTREDSLPCYCYAIKSNSRAICTQVSQLTSADRQSSGHEWTANLSLHNTRTVKLVIVHC